MSSKISDERLTELIEFHKENLRGTRLKEASDYYSDEVSALAELAEYRRSVSEVHEAAIRLVGAAWDDGNGAGLDGWVGPGRGAGEIDAEAEHARTRFVHKADRKLDEVEAVGDE